MIHVTGTSAVALPPAAGLEVKINAALTGTYTVTDAFGAVVAVVTNPTVGNSFTYYGIPSNGSNGGSIIASAVGDATLNILSRMNA